MAIRVYTSGDLPTSNQYIKMRIECALNSQDIAANASNITVNIYFRRTNTGYTTHGNGTCYCKLDGTEYTQAVSDSQVIGYSTGNGISLFTRTFTVSHSTDGSKSITLQGKASLPNTSLGGDYQTFAVTLPTIPRTSTCNAPNLTIGDDLTITIARASTTFVHTLVFACGGVEQSLYNVGASGTFDLSAVAASLYAAFPSATRGEYTITCHTHAGVNGALIGTYVNKGTVLVNAGRAAPVFSDFAFSATRSDLTGSNQKIIAGVSDLTVTISAANRAVSNSGATVKKYIVTVGGKTSEIAWSGSASVSATISKPTVGTISVAAVDSRGNQTVVTKLAAVIAYAAPKITAMAVTRANSVDTSVTLTVSGTWWGQNFGAAANTLSMTYAYKQTNASTWSDEVALTPTISDNKINLTAVINGDLGVSGFTADASFDIRVTVVDKINTITASRVLDRGIPTLHLMQNGAAFGMTATPGVLDTAWSLKTDQGIVPKNLGAFSPDNGHTGADVFTAIMSWYNGLAANRVGYALIDNYCGLYRGLPHGRSFLHASKTSNSYGVITADSYNKLFPVNTAVVYGGTMGDFASHVRVVNFVKSATGTTMDFDFSTDLTNAGITDSMIIAMIPFLGTTSSTFKFTYSLCLINHTARLNVSVNQTYQVYLTVIFHA